jgi:hypothetical protein
MYKDITLYHRSLLLSRGLCKEKSVNVTRTIARRKKFFIIPGLYYKDVEFLVAMLQLNFL